MPGNIMRRWRPDGSVETWRQPSNMANGNAYDPAGRVVTCEHATSRVTRTEADGSITVLATHYGGKELNSPNDIVVKRDGAIYFTDPSFGRMEYYGRPREQELTFQGVYRLDPESGALTLLVDDFDQPNGLCFSLDESQLFVNDTMRGHVRVFDVNESGALGNGRVWAEGDGRPRRRARRHENRRRRPSLRDRSGRHPCLRRGRDLSRRHLHAPGVRQFLLGRGRYEEPVRYREHITVSAAGQRRGQTLVLMCVHFGNPPFPALRSSYCVGVGEKLTGMGCLLALARGTPSHPATATHNRRKTG